MGLGFTFGLTCIAIVREFIGTGAIFGVQILPLADLQQERRICTSNNLHPACRSIPCSCILSCRYEQVKKRAAQKGKKIAEPQDAVQTVHHAADAEAKYSQQGMKSRRST